MLHRKVYDNDGDITTTALEQLKVENSLMKFFFNYRQNQKHLFKKFCKTIIICLYLTKVK